MALAASPCITPNPDIAGVGVRVSIYVQAFLSFVPSVLSGMDGKITLSEYKVLNTTYTTLLLTACALLVSTFVQAATLGLSVYHTLIVLQLSWINNLSAGAWFMIDMVNPDQGDSEDAGGESANLEGGVGGAEGESSRITSQPLSHEVYWGPAFFLASIHLSAMAALGIWLWVKISVFGNQPECTPATFLTLLGHDIQVTRPALRTVSIVLYSLTMVPGLNVFLIIILALSCAILLLVLFSILWIANLIPDKWFDAEIGIQLYHLGVLAAIILDIILVINTEMMIRRSAPLVKHGESDWTFGQTLAMSMVILPLIEVAKQGLKWYKEVEWRASGEVEATDENHPMLDVVTSGE